MKLQAPGILLLALLLAACQPATGPEADTAPAPDNASGPADGDAPAPADAVPTDADAARPDEPGLQVATIDGGEYDLADHRGKWVVVNFWATWCSPCLKEMPELSALHTMREHISVVGLAYEEIDVPSMQSFLDEHPVAYPIAIIDVYAPPADFETPRGLPMTYLIAPDGKVARQFLGPVTAKEIETAIESSGGPALDTLPGVAPEADEAA
ncbi:TlpA family protein disulfide reductase [Luteimonas kalidii]|uniref:TlpA disulfide reductase family protein n=1 Tax=Luteimonas kalidii TaxID=3042025 RepID=A0ABT6JRQ9_9GAMM|nr:TlpA disulfide reductase family protein [Luteimonas kalidii]MDH5833175.1 TlpA disulfide reductase family protein [Luteimonas kalidii]